MPQPLPKNPINVQTSNPYVGLDRGLFVFNKDGVTKYGRIHAAVHVCKGPLASPGVLRFKVMAYVNQPQTAAQYAAGEILKAPDGTEWFDCITRVGVQSPIYAEYWAIAIFIKWYVGEDGIKLETQEIEFSETTAKTFLETAAKWAGLDALEMTASFDAIAGQPLAISSRNLHIEYTKNGVSGELDETTLPATEFDPMRFALNVIKHL